MLKLEKPYEKQAECQEIIGFLFLFHTRCNCCLYLFWSLFKTQPFSLLSGEFEYEIGFSWHCWFWTKSRDRSIWHKHIQRDDKILHYSCMLTYSPQPPSAIYLSLLQALLSSKKIMKSLLIQEYSSRRLAGLN